MLTTKKSTQNSGRLLRESKDGWKFRSEGYVDPFHPSHTGLLADDQIDLWKNDIKKQQLGLYTQAQTTWNETLLLNLDISSGLGAPISEAELRIDLIWSP